MKSTLTESGEWRDGAAAPRLLPENLRKLPGELVGADVDDPDKAHELDAPHVVKALVKDFAKAQQEPRDDTAQKVTKKLWAPGPGERAPVRQWFVDVAKMRVIASLVNRALGQFNAGVAPDLSVKHLWFPNENVNEYELRAGNPPSRRDRPHYLRDIDLVVDVLEPPKSICDLLRSKGIEIDVRKALKQAEEAQHVLTL